METDNGEKLVIIVEQRSTRNIIAADKQRRKKALSSVRDPIYQNRSKVTGNHHTKIYSEAVNLFIRDLFLESHTTLSG